MITTKCECRKCIKNENGHWWCKRFADFTVRDTIELCRQYPMIGETDGDMCIDDPKELCEAREIFNDAIDRHIARYHRNAKVYISGPMTGLPREEYLRRFREAEKQLRANGWTNIVNPINVWACRWPWLYRLLGYRLVLWYDIQLLKTCDRIYLMEGWEKSKGCQKELDVALNENLMIARQVDCGKT